VAFYVKAKVLFHTISVPIRQIFTEMVSLWKDCREQSYLGRN